MNHRTEPDPVDEELEFHLEQRADEHRRAGVPPTEARRRAESAFGDLEATRRYCRRQTRRSRRRRRRRQMLEDIVQDTRFALRQVVRRPAASAVIVLTLTLGIGANTAIFSLVQAAMYRSAPVTDPERLVALWTTCRRGDPRCSSSYPDLLDYRRRATTLADLAGYAGVQGSLGDESGSAVLDIQLSTGNYFGLLGLRPALGRWIGPEDDAPGNSFVAVLSHDLWRARYGGDERIVGRTIRLNATPYEVVGVASAGFDGLSVGAGPDLYVPLLAGPGLTGATLDEARFAERDTRWIGQLIGRMAPAATLEQVRAEMEAISQRLATEDPEARGPRTITVDPAGSLILPVRSEEDFSRFLTILLAVVGLTLLLACANLANLQLARAADRHAELRIRAAIGARRGRLLRQLLTESLILSLLGGLGGLALGPLLLGLLAGYRLPGGISIAELEAGLDPAVLGFTFVLAVATGTLFGIGPALRGAGRGASAPSSARTATESNAALRNGLVALQVGVSLVLLVGAVLFVQALRVGLDLDLGFDRSDDLVIATIDLSLLQYDPATAESFLRTLDGRMRSVTGVEAVAAATRVPLMPGGAATVLQQVLDYQAAPDEELRLEFNFVTPEFFAALGLPLLGGSALLEPTVEPESPLPLVINRDMAERWWPGRDPVGGEVEFFGGRRGRVVGVAADTKWDDGMLTPDYPFAYMPMDGARAAREPIAVLIHATRPEAAMEALRTNLVALEPDVPILELTSFGRLRRTVLLPQRMAATLLGAFATLALLLSAVGIYGVVGHAVARRTREFGIRLALGAERGGIVRMAVGTLVAPLAGGIVVGLAAATLLSDSLRSFLYGVEPVAVGNALLVVALLSAIAGLASWLPARRAARVDPVRTLSAD